MTTNAESLNFLVSNTTPALQKPLITLECIMLTLVSAVLVIVELVLSPVVAFEISFLSVRVLYPTWLEAVVFNFLFLGVVSSLVDFLIVELLLISG